MTAADLSAGPDPANEIARALARRIRGPDADRWTGTADDLPDLAPAAGLRVAAVHPFEPHSYEESPENLARAIERRGFSYLTGVDGDTWKREVEPAVAAIRALPDPERPVKRWSHPPALVVLEREPVGS